MVTAWSKKEAASITASSKAHVEIKAVAATCSVNEVKAQCGSVQQKQLRRCHASSSLASSTIQQAPRPSSRRRCDKQKSTRGPVGRKKGTERGRRCRKKRSRSRVYIREELEGKRRAGRGGSQPPPSLEFFFEHF
ncbi:hypothetical protein LR48_Vigan06g150800 [Vigna angularis]|uniref:Uncharacterized protein n=1 Tax=Phaseolus angularis TaxID=3914 RepID=A0A0L9UUD9_PHAAN|nr:hypothetical protein LR48_Vigan06g150800 [Vigna angularis]